MIMSEGALDLSMPSYEAPPPRPSGRTQDQLSSDSGRASSDSTNSDLHEDGLRNSAVARRLSSSSSSPPHHMSGSGLPVSMGTGSSVSAAHAHAVSTNLPPGLGPAVFPHSSPHPRDLPSDLHAHSYLPPRSSVSPPPPRLGGAPRAGSIGSGMGVDSGMDRYSNPDSPRRSPLQGEEDVKPPALPVDRVSDVRVAPIRPFKMYPVDPFNVYSSPLMPGGGASLSSTPVGLSSLYDSTSPSSFPSFPLTPLTSHLMHRKRRAESREAASSSSSAANSSITASSGGSQQASTASASASPDDTSNNASGGDANGIQATSSSNVTTSSLSRNGDESGGSDGDKKAKLGMDAKKDDAYWDRRRKNNEAAKRSRDARRQKEEEIAMRAAFLEQENLKLRAQVAILKNETAKLHYMLYNRI